jgi:hypothetical protein
VLRNQAELAEIWFNSRLLFWSHSGRSGRKFGRKEVQTRPPILRHRDVTSGDTYPSLRVMFVRHDQRPTKC